MMALIVIVAFMTSVLYQNVHGFKDLEVCISWNSESIQIDTLSVDGISWTKLYEIMCFVHSSKSFQSYHLPLTESSKNTIADGHKVRMMNEVHDMISSPSWSTVNTAVARGKDQPKDIVTDYLLKQRHIHEFSVTGTPKPATTNLNDIFITVKTTKLYHDTRLALIIKTWFQMAKDQVSFEF